MTVEVVNHWVFLPPVIVASGKGKMSTTITKSASISEETGNSKRVCATLRISYGLVLLADVAHLYLHRTLFLATGPWLRIPVGPICLVWIVALVFLILGVRTHSAAVVNWVCCALMLGLIAPNDGFQQAACDSVLIGIALLLLIIPRISASQAQWLLAAFMSSIYVDSGVHKVLSPMWSQGFGVIAPMTLPSLVWIKTGWMSEFPTWFWRVAGYGTPCFELLFPALYIWRRTRLISLCIGIALHVSIGIVYPIPIFAGTMLALYAALLIPELLHQRLDPITWNRRAIAVVCLWALAIADAYQPPAKVIRKAIYMASGIASHGVFEDDAFRRYNYQVRLVPREGPVIPYSRGNLVGLDIRDRVWELWWKRTEAPPVQMNDAEAHLIAWARNARIEARPQIARLDEIAPDLFEENNRIGWVEVGRVENWTVHWNKPPLGPREQFGDYITSALR